MKLGPTIKKVRIERGISQGELAEQSGLSQTYLSLVESNQKNISKQSLEKLCTILEIPLPVLTYLALEKNDIPPDRQIAFEAVDQITKSLIRSVFLPT